MKNDLMRIKKIGLPGLGPRLKEARNKVGMTQEAVAETIGVSWMTVHRWEHEQRTISEDKLERLSQLYGKTMRWFLTVEEGDLDPPDVRSDAARRIYHKVADAPLKYHSMLEKVVGELLEGLESTEGISNSGR
ncbi:MAG: hypothetical protein BZY75_01630 [SAR202 cluster bacterium Io17-Chloro-G7]|nr:MAG: hypothetical protein BZY75_01630 [SAR202 cluster bacterium Io17-Chloro-G7]